MKKRIKYILSVGICLLCLVLLVSRPAAASSAVKNALSVCSGIILPSLLPFFFLSGIMSALGIPALLSSLFGKSMERLFCMSGYAATPLFLGLLGGYPIGAASVAELVREGKLNKDEGEKLLPFCNNTGPAFIIGAVGGGIFSSAGIGIMLYFVHILAAFSLGKMLSSSSCGNHSSAPKEEIQYGDAISSLPTCVKIAVEKCLGICGFVIFFSILGALLEELGLLSFLALRISLGLGLEISFCRSLLSGIMELGGGIASMSGMTAAPLNIALAAFILGFGSLSVHCQTLSVISGTNIKCARHFAGRIIHGLLSAVYAFILSSVLRI